MQVKTSTLSEICLDWAVSVAEGFFTQVQDEYTDLELFRAFRAAGQNNSV